MTGTGLEYPYRAAAPFVQMRWLAVGAYGHLAGAAPIEPHAALVGLSAVPAIFPVVGPT